MKTVLKSTCRMCHGGCGVLLCVEDGRLTSVQGDADSPFNRGRLCAKGQATLELVYHPDRVLFPLKRDGSRGSGRWVRLPWDQALSEIADRLKHLMNAVGPETVAIGQGTGRHHYLDVIRFANALGTPNVIEPGAAQCYLPRVTVSLLTYGDFPVGDYTGETAPQCVLFWGCNPVVSGPDGKVGFAVGRCLDRVPHSIAIDPRRSETARRCSRHLQIRPGTDAALALAMIHVIIEERLYDAAFVEQWTVGFDELRQAVRPCTPEWAAPITWIDAAVIREIARIYAGHRPNILEWGVAVEQTPNSLQTVRSLAILRALGGSLDVSGGELLGMHILRNTPVNIGKNAAELHRKRLGADSFRLLGGPHAFIRMAHAPTVFRAMTTSQPYPVRAFLIFGNNPLATYANAKFVREAILGTDLLVVTDLFRTPTAELADYILPAAAWPEVDGVMGVPYMAENAALVQQKSIQSGECRSDETILHDLTTHLGLTYARGDAPETLDRRLSRIGITFDELRRQGWICPPHRFKKYEQNGFRTPSRKVELSSSLLKELGYAPVPFYQEPPESPVKTPELLERYPLILITGARMPGYFHSEGRQLASLRRHRPEPQAMIHPETASCSGIKQGDEITVISLHGRAVFKAWLSDDIHPNVVSVEHGWWFPEAEGPDHGIWDSNANLLTNDKGPYDPAFGSCHLRALLCRIEKVRVK